MSRKSIQETEVAESATIVGNDDSVPDSKASESINAVSTPSEDDDGESFGIREATESTNVSADDDGEPVNILKTNIEPKEAASCELIPKGGLTESAAIVSNNDSVPEAEATNSSNIVSSPSFDDDGESVGISEPEGAASCETTQDAEATEITNIISSPSADNDGEYVEILETKLDPEEAAFCEPTQETEVTESTEIVGNESVPLAETSESANVVSSPSDDDDGESIEIRVSMSIETECEPEACICEPTTSEAEVTESTNTFDDKETYLEAEATNNDSTGMGASM